MSRMISNTPINLLLKSCLVSFVFQKALLVSFPRRYLLFPHSATQYIREGFIYYPRTFGGIFHERQTPPSPPVGGN